MPTVALISESNDVVSRRHEPGKARVFQKQRLKFSKLEQAKASVGADFMRGVTPERAIKCLYQI